MQPAAYAAWLVKVAMGWLDMDFDQAMSTDALKILIAYDGKKDMFRWIYDAPAPPKLTQQLFRTKFAPRMQ